MRGLRAIKTEYRDVIFRSRAEARWAVLFDKIGVKWLYEYEGFALPSGWYLPDFWLPELHLFAEVKGVASQFSEDAMAKTRDLARASGRSVLLCSDLFEWPNSLIGAIDAGGDYCSIDLVRSVERCHPWIELDAQCHPDLYANGENERLAWQQAAKQAVAYFNNDGRYVP